MTDYNGWLDDNSNPSKLKMTICGTIAAVSLISAALIGFLSGCASITGGDIATASEIAAKVTTEGLTDETMARAKALVDSVRDRGTIVTTPTSIVWIVNGEDPAQDAAQEEVPEVSTEDPAPPPSTDAVLYSALDFCWGGFKGAGASHVAGCEITGLSVSGSGMSYKWAAGGCEALGASDRGDATATLACLFCRIDGEWRGGKFDWISTSRTTRSFTNISEGYHGWDAGAIGKATRYAFVIVSKDGRRRTNVIYGEKK